MRAKDILNKSVPWYFRFKNYQSHDLGLDPMIDDDAKIEDEITKLDKHLDLVMITEYMDESMILLKNLLCADWDVISTTARNAMQYRKTVFANETLQNVFTQLNKMDIALYKYFNVTFWMKVDEYGRDRMDRDLQILRSKQANSKNKFSKTLFKPVSMRAFRPTTREELATRLDCYKSSLALEIADYMMNNSGGCYEYT